MHRLGQASADRREGGAVSPTEGGALAGYRSSRHRTCIPQPAPAVLPTDQRLVQALPSSGALPQRISALVQLARQHGVQLDSVRQSPPQRLGQGQGALAAERVPLRLAGTAPYAAWRRLAADALQQDDALVLAELRLSRNGPADRTLAGTLQWSLLQRLDDGTGPASTAGTAVLARGAP